MFAYIKSLFSVENAHADLTRGSVTSNIIRLTVPLVISNTFATLLEFVDAIFVGRLGSGPLAGVSMGGVVIFFVATLGIGVSVGTIALVSRYTGMKEHDRVLSVAGQSLVLGFVISLVLGIGGYAFSGPIISFLGAGGQVYSLGVGYIRILFAGLFTMFFMFQSSAIFQGTGDAVTPLKISVISSLVNIVLDPLLIFGLAGFPAMGVNGAALATVISRSLGCLLFLRIYMRRGSRLALPVSRLVPDLAVIREILRIGVPGSVQMLMRSMFSMAMVKFVSRFGTVIIAVYGLGGRLFHLFLLPGFGFGSAASILVGQNLGAGRPARAQSSALRAAFFYFVFLSFSVALVMAFTRQAVEIFNREPDVVREGMVFFRYVAAGSLFLSLGFTLSRAMQGAGDTVSTMLITGISLYVFSIPLAFFLAFTAGWAHKGIWTAVLTGDIVHAVLITGWFFTGRWKLRKIG